MSSAEHSTLIYRIVKTEQRAFWNVLCFSLFVKITIMDALNMWNDTNISTLLIFFEVVLDFDF